MESSPLLIPFSDLSDFSDTFSLWLEVFLNYIQRMAQILPQERYYQQTGF